METHQGDEYGKAARTEYDDIKQRLTLLLTKYGLEDTLGWLEAHSTTEELKSGGAERRVEIFMSKMKAEIRRNLDTTRRLGQ